MPLFLRIAWRNIFRNRRRSIIAILALSCGLASLIIVDAFMLGIKENMINNATGTFLGDAQIQNSLFYENGEVEHTISYSEILLEIEKRSEIKHYSPRVITSAMLTSPSSSIAIQLWGVHSEYEREISMLSRRISSESEFLPRPHSILIGEAVAKELDIELGEQLLITVAKAGSGEPVQHLFTVDGIFSFGTKELDMAVATIQIEKLQDMLGISSDRIHQIALKLKNSSLPLDREHHLWGERGDILWQPWPELMPELMMILGMSSYSRWVVGTIIFLIVGLNIVNTLFMAIYERFYEFAVLKSIGTSNWQIFRMIIYEALSLATISAILGSVIGYFLTLILNNIGVNYNSMEFGGVVFYEKIYPIISINQYVSNPLFLTFFTAVVSIYPALFASRLNPAKTMKKTL